MKKTLYLLPFLCLPALAQTTANRLSPLMQQQTAQLRQTRAAADATLPAFIHITDDSAVDALRQLGVTIGTRVGNILTARVPLGMVGKLSTVEGVRYVDGATAVRPMLDKARAVTGVDRIHQGEGLTQAYTGKGVLVGVVDAGFDYRHPAFRAADAATSRILRSWEQSYDGGTPPTGSNYGSEIVGGENLINASGDVTTSSHGSHVLGIAAGRDCGQGWGGVAPEADIALVSMGATTVGNVNIADGVAYIFNLAKSRQQPCVVNLSLGTQMGPHDGTSTFDQLTDAIQGEGCILVGSAGNFGADPIHIAATNGQEKRVHVDYKSAVGSSSAGSVDLWGTKGSAFKVQAQIVKLSTGEVSVESDLIDASLAEGSTTQMDITTNAKGSLTITTEINPLNGRPHALVSLGLKNFRSGYGLVLRIVPDADGSRVDAWADDVYVQFGTDKKYSFDKPDTDRTLAEIGGTGKRIISVGSFTTRNEYTLAGSTRSTTIDETVGDISSFSSAGPALDGRMKPDVTAPGCLIISALNGNSSSLSSELLADGVEFEGHSHYWGYMQGTSMAAPFVAGTVALWLEANPTLTPEQVRDVLDHSAAATEATTADAAHWGRGKLDAWEGLKYVVSTVGIQNASAAAPTRFSVRRTAGRNVEVLLASSAAHAPIRLYSATGALLQEVKVGVTTGTVVIPTAALPAGTYILNVDGQSVKLAL